jgi:hypothetical protein
MSVNIETFRDHIIVSDVLDREGIHHEFSKGMHGQKLDFDVIPDNYPLYREWIDVAASYISDSFPRLPQVIVGVANGTNRVALDTARKFDGRVFGAVSEKDKQNSKILYLASMTGRLIRAMKPEFVVVIEDVGTTGSNAVQVARQVLEAGAQSVEVINTWQRRPQLELLDEAGIPHRAIINEPLPTYSPEDCATRGFCSDSWKLIPR